MPRSKVFDVQNAVKGRIAAKVAKASSYAVITRMELDDTPPRQQVVCCKCHGSMQQSIWRRMV
jgi:hypothetical protein